LYKAPKNIEDNEDPDDLEATTPNNKDISSLDTVAGQSMPNDLLVLPTKLLDTSASSSSPIPSNATDAVTTVLFPSSDLYPATFTDTFLRTGSQIHSYELPAVAEGYDFLLYCIHKFSYC
jgi:hypothetical protein